MSDEAATPEAAPRAEYFSPEGPVILGGVRGSAANPTDTGFSDNSSGYASAG